MKKEQLQEILEKHQKWLDYDIDGERATLIDIDLTGANLTGANLTRAVLTGATLIDIDLRGANLTGANLRGADLRGATLIDIDLRGANLTRAVLTGANLTRADLDFSSWPLWCGSLGVKTDARIARQLAYHLCSLDCDDEEYLEAKDKIKDFANRFHRVDECGLIE